MAEPKLPESDWAMLRSSHPSSPSWPAVLERIEAMDAQLSAAQQRAEVAEEVVRAARAELADSGAESLPPNKQTPGEQELIAALSRYDAATERSSP